MPPSHLNTQFMTMSCITLLCFDLWFKFIRPSLCQVTLLGILSPQNHIGGDGGLSLSTALRRDQDVEPSRRENARCDDDQANVGDAETEDVKGVLSQGVECWVGETEDDGEDRAGDEAEQRAPEEGDAPVLTACDDDIEIASKILPLLIMVSMMDNKKGV